MKRTNEVLSSAFSCSRFVVLHGNDNLMALFNATGQGLRGITCQNGNVCCANVICLDTLRLSTTLSCCTMQILSTFATASLLRERTNAHRERCACGRCMEPGDIDHAMTCTSLGGVVTLRHDILTET